MKLRNALGYFVATFSILFGVLIIFGYLLTPNTSSQFRWTLGTVMVLFGIYRSVLLYFEAKRKKME